VSISFYKRAAGALTTAKDKGGRLKVSSGTRATGDTEATEEGKTGKEPRRNQSQTGGVISQSLHRGGTRARFFIQTQRRQQRKDIQKKHSLWGELYDNVPGPRRQTRVHGFLNLQKKLRRGGSKSFKKQIQIRQDFRFWVPDRRSQEAQSRTGQEEDEPVSGWRAHCVGAGSQEERAKVGRESQRSKEGGTRPSLQKKTQGKVGKKREAGRYGRIILTNGPDPGRETKEDQGGKFRKDKKKKQSPQAGNQTCRSTDRGKKGVVEAFLKRGRGKKG